MKLSKARIRVSLDGCPIMDTKIIPDKKNFKNILDILEDKLE